MFFQHRRSTDADIDGRNNELRKPLESKPREEKVPQGKETVGFVPLGLSRSILQPSPRISTGRNQRTITYCPCRRSAHPSFPHPPEENNAPLGQNNASDEKNNASLFESNARITRRPLQLPSPKIARLSTASLPSTSPNRHILNYLFYNLCILRHSVRVPTPLPGSFPALFSRYFNARLPPGPQKPGNASPIPSLPIPLSPDYHPSALHGVCPTNSADVHLWEAMQR
jgi:hypothetical protein